jgi:GDP-4-dehydro-6-deoxy-D-mannose reductase
MKKKIIVFGSTGFIGRNLLNYVAQTKMNEKYSFIFVSRTPGVKEDKEFVHKYFDVTDFSKLSQFLIESKPDYIINLAGVISGVDLDTCLKVNAEFPRKILENIIIHNLKVENVLLIGSAAEYGENSNFPISEAELLQPLNPYGLSKVIQFEYFKFYSKRCNVNLARTFNVIGPYMSNKLAIGSFIEKINNCQNKGQINTGSLSSKRDYLHVYDVVSAFFDILFKGESGEVYNICSGEAISMNNILDSLIHASGKNIKVKVDESLFNSINVSINYGDNSKLKKLSGWDFKMDLKESCKELFNKNLF